MRNTLRYTLRQFRMSPIFTAAATVTLALGIGGTTAIFTMIHAVMLRSLPVSDPAYCIGSGTATIAAWKGGRRTAGECFPFRSTSG